MKIALFGGSFDPVHREHVALVRAAKQSLALDRVIVIPAYISPFKSAGAVAAGKDRIQTCKLAFRGVSGAEVSSREIDGAGTSYTYLTCRHFRNLYPHDELFFLAGADALKDFEKWKNPEEILSCVTLASCGRAGVTAEEAATKIYERFGKRVSVIDFQGESVSSSRIRVELAFGKKPSALDETVYEYIREKGLYSYPQIMPALALEKQERQEHSFRVALLAAEYAPRFGISCEKAILASALHDCGKYVPLDSPLLKGFVLPEGVPPPVVHQYTGAYLAERVFGISDGEILDAIRYHTSGKENMSALGKLVFLADMLEEGRDFEGIGFLRAALERDLDECLLLCLERQIGYLKNGRVKDIYALTEQAYAWIKNKMNGRA